MNIISNVITMMECKIWENAAWKIFVIIIEKGGLKAEAMK